MKDILSLLSNLGTSSQQTIQDDSKDKTNAVLYVVLAVVTIAMLAAGAYIINS